MAEEHSEDWNPFEIIGKGADRHYRGADRVETAAVPSSQVKTTICISDGDEDDPDVPGSAQALLELPVLWWPQKGDKMWVSFPNRLLRVVGVKAQFDPFGFTSIVYLHDPERP